MLVKDVENNVLKTWTNYYDITLTSYHGFRLQEIDLVSYPNIFFKKNNN